MARPREFDEEKVLDEAMRVFWEKGYEATSMQDLLATTGLTRGSLYKAFSSKHHLFVRALERYLDSVLAVHAESLDSDGSPRQRLAAWFSNMLDFAEANGGPRMGCLAVNSSIELGPHDPQVAEMLAVRLHESLELFVACLAEGQESGEIRSDLAPQDLATLMVIFHTGNLVSLRSTQSKEQAKALAAEMLQLLTP